MQLKPFKAVLPTATGQTKIQTATTTDWDHHDTIIQPDSSYYWYELTLNGVHQWRLIASWPIDQTVTTMVPGAINTVLYPQQPVIEMLIDDWVGHFAPIVEVTDTAHVTHRLWQITEPEVNTDITAAMAPVTPQKTWLTTISTPLVMLVSTTEWQKFATAPAIPDQLIAMATPHN
ncbi:DUF1015 family protein [Lactiplantibacillus paraplantarum]|uniref:Uncharacterized protein n=1 Tax=Lactiplantibacillus paraplantarum TaxID=60520 RepID=A0AAD0X6W4_9LACO|nr:hypothetical protein [Lactiplantibacillus paraplantarum]AVW10776.1 hypothetical protein DA077_09620 [Lactiplantibacillus paraplantarum]AYJ39127.1 hypothetical protein LP667_10095 [Lactiplantibacillus paraplantarum]KRL49647.1 hypothetical protein FD48_GL003203 [Lactiplantibacillus paraplantarum DSM 10667]MCU4684177.1 DUF1015 domain-containing protein [Lactiplantibacillus paraplantarum]MDL2062253.1 hypothetical protein [Lactiplantibacillus paraplantarum]